DEQSIEQSLSTFSSHMTNIVRILKGIDHQSLVLFDELGAGTDPTEGAALAIAILDYVKKSGSLIVATTHYSELKVYAYNRPDVMNASVEFDVATLRPTYRLLVGVPGKSNAFAISERLGLPKNIIDIAQGQISEEDQSLEKMIENLESSRKQAEQEHKKAEAIRREVELLKQKLEQQTEQFEAEKNNMMLKAEAEAEQAIKKALEEAEEIITELRRISIEEQAGIKEHRLIDARKRLQDAVPTLGKKQKPKPTKKAPATQQIQIGDQVTVLTLGQKGHIAEQVGKDEYQVQVGIMKLKVHAQDLEVQRPVKEKQKQSFTKVNRTTDENVRYELDLRGTNVEEAIMDIDKYLDNALLSGFGKVHLIHGKGTGVLRSG
ncbi:MAG: MutS2/Smr-associated SH3 domain-containing protein, partial [Bacilli bacterium]